MNLWSGKRPLTLVVIAAAANPDPTSTRFLRTTITVHPHLLTTINMSTLLGRTTIPTLILHPTILRPITDHLLNTTISTLLFTSSRSQKSPWSFPRSLYRLLQPEKAPWMLT